MQKRDQDKPTYSADTDTRSPALREKQLIDSARAEGRPQPDDGTRPLSSADTPPPTAKKEEGSFRHIVHTGMPPGIDAEDAVDPGMRNRSDQTTTRNRS
ncbi:MAG: hypothetical protein JWN73_61 [Betaproteobacteria bacterium]|nr:hypothetical protein [Betaproteobacteria bacterium]